MCIEKTLFISLWNVAGAFHSPKGIMKTSQWLQLVLKIALPVCSYFISIWWYPKARSNLENTLAWSKHSNKASIHGNRKRSFTICLFSALLPIHICHLMMWGVAPQSIPNGPTSVSSTVLFRNKQNWRTIGTNARPNEPLRQEILHLRLNFISLS